MKFLLTWFGFLCFNVYQASLADIDHQRSGLTRIREARKLFGGYRITPKYCKATKSSSEALDAVNNVNICMFNHECGQRNGQVVGACMDGFLFGACCQLPKDSMVGAEFLSQDYPAISILDNGLNSNPPSTTRKTTPMFDITSHGMSQITAALLGGNPPFSGGINSNILPTGNGNSEVVINSWSSSGVTHSVPDATINNEDNEINPIHFSSTNRPLYGDNNKATTLRYGETSLSSSGAPLGYTPVPVKQKPMFRPKPQKPSEENYVLVSTISPVKNTIDNNDALSTSASLLPFSTVRPLTSFASTARPQGTSNKPPSTSYVFSSTVPSRRTTTTSNKRRKPEKNTVKYSSSTPKPLKVSSSRPKLPSTSYVYSSTFNPTRKPPNGTYLHSSTYRPQTVAHSTYASTPEAFPSGSQSTSSSSYIPVSSTATYHPSTLTTSISGPSFSVTSRPPTAQYSGISSPAPTVIVLGSVDDQFYTTTTTSRPGGVHQLPQKKPPNHVIINNHVTQNIYNTQKPSITASSQDLPSPTVIITPKPTASSTSPSPSSSSSSIVEEDLEGIVVTSSNDFINFPPDRNPNLNISHPSYNDLDLTTPLFIENDDANEKVESFVNQIIYGLQEPFNDLKDIVYNDRPNNTTTQSTQSPVGTSTKKPNKKQGTTTKRPITVRTTTKKPTTTRRSTTTRRPNNPTTTTTTRKPVTTRRPPTTIQNYIETETTPLIQQSYRDQCGARPLLKSGRIVGGRGSAFGEFPWQVLVRESTWLGLFTKNKCGGVLISDKYVITAAHCQPGFLAALVTVFGEYDISGDLESRKPVSRNVKRVVVHRKYDAATFENDLALLELESPVKFDAHIIPICLPAENTDYTKRMATVTGWGRLKYGGGVPSVLQEVQVPVMENHVCQDMFRTAGHSKVILESFLCAGYANGQKDACEGDSGGPLVVQRSDGRYELAGTVSHGIKCAAPYLPGVYMRTTYYKPWITSVTGVE